MDRSSDPAQVIGERLLGYAERLYRTLGRGTGRRRRAGGGWYGLPRLGAADVEDLVQETLARAFHRATKVRLDPERDLGPYLTTIACNLCIDMERQRTRTGRAVPLDGVELAAGGDEQERPEATVALGAYLAGLPLELRRLYEARYERGLSQREAAAALAITRRNVRTLEARLLAGAARAVGIGPPRARRRGERPLAALDE
jgi:RNA polymerase sigma factor CnrH